MLLVFVGFFVLMMSLSFLTSFITIRFDIGFVSKEWLGIIGSVYSLGMTLGSFRSAHLIARLGFVRSYVVFCSLIGLSILTFGFFFHPLFWVPIRFIIGYSLGAVFAIVESWIILDSPDDQKGRSLSLYSFVLYLGYGLAPYLFRLIPDLKSMLPLVIMGFLCFLSIFLMAIVKSNSPLVESHNKKLMIKEAYETAPIGFVQCMGSGVMNIIIYVFFPKIMYYHPYIHFTYLISATILGGVIFQYPIGLLSDYYSRRVVIMSLNMAVICLIPLCVIFFNTIALFFLLLVLGGCILVIYPLSISHTCDFFPKQSYFSIVQTLLLVYGIGSIIGPFIVTSIFFNMFSDMTAVFAALMVTSSVLLVHGLTHKR